MNLLLDVVCPQCLHFLRVQDGEVPTADMSLGHWHKILAVNLTGIFLFCREYLRQLRDHANSLRDSDRSLELERFNAAIVLIGGTASVFGWKGHSAYSAAKSGYGYGLVR